MLTRGGAGIRLFHFLGVGTYIRDSEKEGTVEPLTQYSNLVPSKEHVPRALYSALPGAGAGSGAERR